MIRWGIETVMEAGLARWSWDIYAAIMDTVNGLLAAHPSSHPQDIDLHELQEASAEAVDSW